MILNAIGENAEHRVSTLEFYTRGVEDRLIGSLPSVVEASQPLLKEGIDQSLGRSNTFRIERPVSTPVSLL